MKKIIDYTIKEFGSFPELNTWVKEQLIDGWQPFKRPVINNYSRGNGDWDAYYSQVMVKYEETNSDKPLNK